MRTRPRVAIVTNIVSPYRVDLFEEVADVLDEIEIKVFFCRRTFPDRLWRISEPLGFPNAILNPLPTSPRSRRLVNLDLAPRLIAYRPRALLASEYSVPTAQSYVLSLLLGVPFGIWTDGTQHSEEGLSRLQLAARRFLLPRAAVVVASSSEGSERVRSLGADPAKTYVSILTGDNSGIARAAELRQRQKRDLELLLRVQPPLFLCIANLEPHKGLHHLIGAFSDLHREGVTASLYLVGHGHTESQLRAQVAAAALDKFIHFAGFVDREHVLPYWTAADAFVLPTLNDRFGLVIGEAAAAGLPIIATPFAGATRDFVFDGWNGYVVDPRNREEFTSRLRTLALMPAEQRALFGQRSRQIAERLSVERAALEMAKAIERLVHS